MLINRAQSTKISPNHRLPRHCPPFQRSNMMCGFSNKFNILIHSLLFKIFKDNGKYTHITKKKSSDF